MSSSPRFLGIDHLGLAVEDVEAVARVYEALGFPIVEREEVADQRVKVVKVACGDSDLELLESTDPDGPIGRYLAKKGPGIHHVAIRVADLAATLGELEAAGVRLIDRTPRLGAGGKRIAFLHPKATGGILVELCQPAEEDA